jgi:alpha-tubulin suppressor-like RCC1 family protein
MSGFYSNGENFDRIFFTEHQLVDRYIGNRAFGTGFNLLGALGDGTTVSKSVFVDISGIGSTWKQISSALPAATGGYGAAVKTDGTLWTWGNGPTGQLGTGTTLTSRSSPNTTIVGGTDWNEVSASGSHVAAIKFDGSLWTWGNNTAGQLGTGTTTSRSSPNTVTGAVVGSWLHVASAAEATAASGFTVAVKTDGTLWTWGVNSNGQLGTGNTTDRSSPGTTIIGGYDWVKVAAGGQTCAAIKNDGTLWTWGRNQTVIGGFTVGTGALGDGTTNNRSSPGTTVGGGTNWKQITVSGGSSAGMAAIKTDGTLWTWGININGNLGDGTSTARSSPGTTVGGGTNWKQVSTTYSTTAAVKTDGSIWTWGLNGQGQLGDGTTASRSSPGTVLGGIAEWSQVSVGGYFDGTASRDNTLAIAYFL